ncbi:hypothetical protein AA650_12595 [Anabaena sp. WA102]|nr:hypothetical protein AA650_12595 [Anabaena sp. WA102]
MFFGIELHITKSIIVNLVGAYGVSPLNLRLYTSYMRMAQYGRAQYGKRAQYEKRAQALRPYGYYGLAAG